VTTPWNDLNGLLSRLGGIDLTSDPGAALLALTDGVEDAIGFETPGGRLLFLRDPALVGELLVADAAVTTKGPGLRQARALLGNGLLTSEGDDHARARRLVGPAFARFRLEQYGAVMADRARTHSDAWADGSTLDMHRAMTDLTLDIVGRTLFGLDLASESESIRLALTDAIEAFRQMQGVPFSPGNPGAIDVQPARTLTRIIDEIVTAHRIDPTDRGDVISALVAAVDDGGEAGLTDQEVRDNVMTLLLAGHETTANALSWTWLLLHQHPEVAARLEHEVDTLAGVVPTFQTLPALGFVRAVVTESMRLYPPAWIIGRSTTEDLRLGATEVPAGTTVVASPWVLHRDPRWYPDPERFDPDRWLGQGSGAVPRYAYMPFGAGPRSCIGEQFAWTEAILVLATIAARWKPELEADAVVEREYRITLRPRAMPMILHRR